MKSYSSVLLLLLLFLLLSRITSSQSFTSSSSLSLLSSTSYSPFTYSLYIWLYIFSEFLFKHNVEAVQGCSIFYQSDYKWKKALCDSEVNKLTQLPTNLPDHLIELRVLHQAIGKIKRAAVNHLIHLETFHIESSQVKQIESDTFRQLISLKYINLRNNSLTISRMSFPVELLNDLPNLRSLNLAENPIDFIPDAFFDSLSGNKLQYLWFGSVKSTGIKFESNTLKPLTYLRLLDLSFTGLNSLDASNELVLNNMPELKEFYLGGNPWTCDCKLSWLKLWFLQESSKGGLRYQLNKTDLNGNIEVSEPVCFKPDSLKGKYLFSDGSNNRNNNNKYNAVQFSDLRCPPQIFTSNENFTLDFGKTLLLRCEYHSPGIDNLQWYKDDQLVQNTSEKMIIQGQAGSNFYSNLIVASTTGEHTGLWSCVLNPEQQTIFSVAILNSDGRILYPSDEKSFMHGAFLLFGISGDTKNWIYVSIAVIILFVMLAIIGVGIFCCCEPQTRTSDLSAESQTLQETHDKKKKKCSGTSYSLCKCRLRCFKRRNNTSRKSEDNKDDSLSSLMVAGSQEDERKIIDKGEVQLANNMKSTSTCSKTLISTAIVDSNNNDVSNNLQKRNVEDNRLLNIFCCPTNTTREVQVVTLPTIESSCPTSLTGVTHLGGSLIHETVATGGNRLLVSCDSPEPKLLIANGITPCSNISPVNFSACLQPQQVSVLQHQSNPTVWDSNQNPIMPELLTPYTSSNQIAATETSKPCPVHGLMKLKHVELISNTTNTMPTTNSSTTPSSNCDTSRHSSNYQKIDSVYWDHSNLASFLNNTHLAYNISNCVLLNTNVDNKVSNNVNNSTNSNLGETVEVIQNYAKTLPKNGSLLQNISMHDPNLQWPSDSLPHESCPLHGLQTLTRRKSKAGGYPVDVTSIASNTLKTHHFSKPLINSQSNHQLHHPHGKEDGVHSRKVTVYSSNDNTSEQDDETDQQSNSDHDTGGRRFLLPPLPGGNKHNKGGCSSSETGSQGESSVCEKCPHSDCADSDSSTSSSTASSVNQKFKLAYPSNQTRLNSVCSSLSNQLNLSTAVVSGTVGDETPEQQSPPSPEFYPPTRRLSRPSSSNGRPINYHGNRNSSVINKLNENANCPVHSLRLNRKSISGKIFYDSRQNYDPHHHHHHQHKNNLNTLRGVTTLPSRFRKVNSANTSIIDGSNTSDSIAFMRKFASQHTVKSNCSSSLCLSAQSLDKYSRQSKPILRPGSKHKLDTESDSDTNNNNTSEENNNFVL
uniref:Ig-like domain-containing protein n=1 Tax=Trichobilharzia regenti TaxID=157069 RepID=A0AA85KM32_TRIRE|nr:unnamed protein product [Trichobilharzia regenti]